MEEASLLKMSLLCSLAGIVGLYLVSQLVETPQTPIQEIVPEEVGKTVRVCGWVTKMFVSPREHIFLKLGDGGDLDVVIFNSTASQADYEVQVGDQVCVLGKVSEYRGKLELISLKPIELRNVP